MPVRDGRFTAATVEFLERVEAQVLSTPPDQLAGRVRHIVEEHEEWRGRRCLNLNAAETVMSRRARRLLATDMATRVSEGFPADKEFPAPPQNVHIDQIEAIIIALLRAMFGARFVEWRPVSTSMANATVFFALCKPGDVILAQPETAGGNYSYNPVGSPSVARLKVQYLPCNEPLFEIDGDAAAERIRAVRPRMVVVGGSNILFPYPVGQLRQAADDVGALVLYDAAHVGAFIGAGAFQDPLAEGAHLLTMSSHKIMSGAVGGFVLMNDPEIAEAVLRQSFPSLMQTRDQNKLAATAHALCELHAHGKDYVAQTLENARALARALEQERFTVLAAERDYTMTHQIFLNLDDHGARRFESLCQRSNILVSKTQHMSESTNSDLDLGGARLTTQELTRQGMKEEDMTEVARFIRRAVIDEADPARLRADIEAFLEDFYEIRFSFDGD